MRCPCLEHGECPIEHLAERVAALEQQLQRPAWDKPEQAAQPQQPRSCYNCKNEQVSAEHDPCFQCRQLSHWQPREPYMGPADPMYDEPREGVR